MKKMNMLDELGTIVLDTHSLGGFTDEEFFYFCLDNKDLKFERDATGNIYIISNTGGKTGHFNHEVNLELGLWNRKMRMGICFNSSTAFRLPNTAVRSPDAAWIKNERWNTLTEKEKEQFPPICPNFVIEIKSHTDNINASKIKIQEWIDNGCQLAWLIDPEIKTAYIFSPDASPKTVTSVIINGADILPGFQLDLKALFS